MCGGLWAREEIEEQVKIRRRKNCPKKRKWRNRSRSDGGRIDLKRENGRTGQDQTAEELT